MSKVKKKGRVMFVFICIIAFIVSFLGSAIFKMTYTSSKLKKYTVQWNDEIGKTYTDLSYGKKPANKFDLYVPNDNTKETYGLIVYLHAGGFTTGDKSDDAKMLQWLCSKGYVAAGINYTLKSDKNPEANVYTQSVEIKESIPHVIEEAKNLGYNINQMAISGGSAGHALAMIYAYRDANTSPVPVKMVFGGVGPSSFSPEDWDIYGFDKTDDKTKENAALFFSVMAGKEIKKEDIGTSKYDEKIKDISAVAWIDENSVPSLLAYGKYDKVQPFKASIRLSETLKKYNVPHDYIVFEHSGHGLQNDSKESKLYLQKIEEYLAKYLPLGE